MLKLTIFFEIPIGSLKFSFLEPAIIVRANRQIIPNIPIFAGKKGKNKMAIEPNKVIYSMIGVSKYYNQKPVLKDIYLSYFYGAKIGVLGLNGSGKSSLLRILAGIDKDFNGETAISPGFTVGILEQEPKLDDSKTVKEIVQEGVQEIVDVLKEYDEINAKFAEPMSDDEMNDLLERQGKVQDKLDSMDAWDLDSKLDLAMDVLNCPPPYTPIKVLSGGERRRVALCRLLLQKPDILLLDEPTNHLDAETVLWLEAELNRYPGTVIAVTHDRYFLDNVAGWILELDRGQGIPWKGNYSSWLDQKQQRLFQEEKKETERQKTLKRELEWVRMAPRARHAKSKARINAYEEMLNEENEKRDKDLEIYNLSLSLFYKTHAISLQLPKYELYELGSQVRRSSDSVITNIVEGYGRKRYQADFIKFLVYSHSSNLETINHLEKIEKLYPDFQKETTKLIAEYDILGAQIYKFIQYVENNWK